MSDEERLYTAFDDCLTRLNAGQSVNDCLRAYPDLADELRPMLNAAEAALHVSRVPRAVQMRSRAKFLTAAGERRPKTVAAWWRPLSTVLAMGAILMIVWVAYSALDTTVLNPQTPTPSPTVTASPTTAPSETATQVATPTASQTLTPTEAPPTATRVIATNTPVPTVTQTALLPTPTQPPVIEPSPEPAPSDGTNESDDDDSGDDNDNSGSGNSGSGDDGSDDDGSDDDGGDDD